MTHDHDHRHATDNRARLLGAVLVTTVILVAEVAGAALTGSLALLVDAGHMLTDTIGLLVALVAASLVLRPATSRHTWGWRRAEVIAAAGQAAILLLVGLYALYEGLGRLIHPPTVDPTGMLVVGALGLAGNLASLLILSGGKDHNLNMRAAFLEVTADALGSIAVLAAAGVITVTGWTRADAVAGVAVACLILPRAALLLRESGAILLEATPGELDLDTVRAHILRQEHVLDVHDLHASTVAAGLPVLTCHVVVDEACFTDGRSLTVLEALHACVQTHHALSIEHATFQLEPPRLAEEHRAHFHT